jgi:hypothetical protein
MASLPLPPLTRSWRSLLRKQRRKPKESEAPPVDGDGEPVLEVQRLEDRALFEVEGEIELKRFFKVRWEGDWPEDQKLSWEPEETLPAELVRNYLKTNKRRKAHFRVVDGAEVGKIVNLGDEGEGAHSHGFDQVGGARVGLRRI